MFLFFVNVIITEMNKQIPQVLKGFRDFLPADMAVRNFVVKTLRETFEKFGFEPLETPALEYGETIMGKYGDEADKLVYQFMDNGERKVALRYDLTVPTARVLANYQDLVKPFKRYQIQSVWRADKPQKGRYREFTQCDIDTFGASNPLSDAEIIQVIYESLKALKIPEFVININSRQVLFTIMEKSGIEKEKWLTVIQTLDKLEKIGKENVESELTEKKSLTKEQVKKIFELLQDAEPDIYLNDVLKIIEKLGVPKENVKFLPTLSRGLDYYTGPIFEVTVKTASIGSVAGGGRYDELIGTFTGQGMPAVGTTLGLDRLCDVITELKLIEISTTQTRVLVTIFSPELFDKSVEITKQLREQGINTELYLDLNAKLEKQLKYADRKGIPYAIIIGPEEAEKNTIKLKDLQKQNQQEVTKSGLLTLLA